MILEVAQEQLAKDDDNDDDTKAVAKRGGNVIKFGASVGYLSCGPVHLYLALHFR